MIPGRLRLEKFVNSLDWEFGDDAFNTLQYETATK